MRMSGRRLFAPLMGNWFTARKSCPRDGPSRWHRRARTCACRRAARRGSSTASCIAWKAMLRRSVSTPSGRAKDGRPRRWTRPAGVNSASSGAHGESCGTRLLRRTRGVFPQSLRRWRACTQRPQPLQRRQLELGLRAPVPHQTASTTRFSAWRTRISPERSFGRS